MRLNFRHNQSGFSLVEIIISMAIGSILVAGVTSVYVDTIKNSADNITSVRLEQDLQAIVQMVSQEMRRVGFDGDSVNGGDTDFGIKEISSTCIRYNYDMGAIPDGSPTANEMFAFRLVNNSIQFGSSVVSCADTNASWVNINNSNTVLVTSFTLDLVELCINLKNNSNCNSADSTTDPVDPYVVPSVGDKMIKNYQLVLNVAVRPANDSLNSKSVMTKIRLFNGIKTTKV